MADTAQLGVYQALPSLASVWHVLWKGLKEEKNELSVNLKKIISDTNALLSPDKRVLERLSASLYSKS